MSRNRWPAARRGVGVLSAALALMAAAHSPRGLPPPDGAVGRAVQLAHWWAYYESMLEARTETRVDIDPMAHGAASQVLPALRGKYDGTPAANGMDLLVAAEFRRLRAALPPAQANALSSWSVDLRRCTAEGPAILTTVDAASRRLCVAPVLVTSIFLQSAGTDLARLTARLRKLGIAPATFTGEYVPSLNQRGVTSADWRSVLGAYSEPTWSRMRGSVDVVLARLILCGALAKSKPSCGRDALALARRTEGAADASSLAAVLTSANAGYAPSSWGYEVAGDGIGARAWIDAPSAP